ncbi:MAG: PKD domain-containing protein [Bacteroidia bacterium]
MKRLLFVLTLVLSASILHGQQVQYCLESRQGPLEDSLHIYMQSTSNDTVTVAAANISLVFHDSCTQAPHIIFDEFENSWGNFVLRTDTAYNLNVTYNAVSYDTRWQYANADTNIFAPNFVVIPADTNARRLVLSLAFPGTCGYDVYVEDVSENPVAQLGSAFFIPIPYAISRTPCDSCQAIWAAEIDSATYQATFSNSSITAPGPTSFEWDFGDGMTSDSLAPTHVYPGPGTYPVSLIIGGNGCADTFTADVVIPAPACEASFTFVTSFDKVDFTGSLNTGDANAASWLWDFGDSNTSILQNPSHTYTIGGQYSVCLTVTDIWGCVDSSCQTVDVESCTAGFTKRNISDVEFQFSGQSQADTTAWFWTFGDGTSSIEQSPVHSYIASGARKYEVCLRVTNPLTGCRDSICDSVEIIITNIEKPSFSTARIYPNPCEGHLVTDLAIEEYGLLTYHVYNHLGQLVWEQAAKVSPGFYTKRLNLQTLPAGHYWLQTALNGNLSRSPFVKR